MVRPAVNLYTFNLFDNFYAGLMAPVFLLGHNDSLKGRDCHFVFDRVTPYSTGK